MAVEHVAGSTDPVVTSETTAVAETKTKVVTVEGPMELLDAIEDISEFVPGGYTYDTHKTDPTGDGFGKITIVCREFGEVASSGTPTRTTWKIQMAAVQKDLKMHPWCVEDRLIIEMWLNTDPIRRFDANGVPQYTDSKGTAHQIEENSGADFYVTAYMKGVETYNEYYPILQKISYYKRLPGVSMNGKSTTTGHVSEFSGNIGRWSVPGITLNGYGDTGWFKSGDDYAQDNSLKWTRTEEWTWTPEGSDGDLGWIYRESEDE